MNPWLTLAQLEEYNSKFKKYLIDGNFVCVGMLLFLIKFCAQSYNDYSLSSGDLALLHEDINGTRNSITPLCLFCR